MNIPDLVICKICDEAQKMSNTGKNGERQLLHDKPYRRISATNWIEKQKQQPSRSTHSTTTTKRKAVGMTTCALQARLDLEDDTIANNNHDNIKYKKEIVT